jgi:hypothetical protein
VRRWCGAAPRPRPLSGAPVCRSGLRCPLRRCLAPAPLSDLWYEGTPRFQRAPRRPCRSRLSLANLPSRRSNGNAGSREQRHAHRECRKLSSSPRLERVHTCGSAICRTRSSIAWLASTWRGPTLCPLSVCGGSCSMRCAALTRRARPGSSGAGGGGACSTSADACAGRCRGGPPDGAGAHRRCERPTGSGACGRSGCALDDWREQERVEDRMEGFAAGLRHDLAAD